MSQLMNNPKIKKVLPDNDVDLDKMYQIIIDATSGKTELTRESLKKCLSTISAESNHSSIKPDDSAIVIDRDQMYPETPTVNGLFAQVDGKTVALIMYHLHWTPWLTGHIRVVDLIYVEPQYRNRGIVRLLLNNIMDSDKHKNSEYVQFNSALMTADQKAALDSRPDVKIYRGPDSDWSVSEIKLV